MFQHSQEILNEVIQCILNIVEAVGFLAGYALAKLHGLGEFFEKTVDSIFEGYEYGQPKGI